MRHEEVSYSCDECGRDVGNSDILDISITTPECFRGSHGGLHFCSFAHFRDYFNKAMKEDKIEIEIGEGL